MELLTAGLGAIEDDVKEEPSEDDEDDCSMDLSGTEDGDSAQAWSLSKLKSTTLLLLL